MLGIYSEFSKIYFSLRTFAAQSNKQQEKWLLEETKQELLDALEKNEDIQDKLRNTQANITEDKRPIKTKAKGIVQSFLDKMGNKK